MALPVLFGGAEVDRVWLRQRNLAQPVDTLYAFFPWWLSLNFSGGPKSVDLFWAGHWPSEQPRQPWPASLVQLSNVVAVDLQQQTHIFPHLT